MRSQMDPLAARKEEAGSTTKDSPTMLIVDDNDPFRQQLVKALERRGYIVRNASSVEQALTLAREESPEFAVLDLKMPGESGLTLLEKLLEIDSTTKILILTGYGSIATAVSAIRTGAVNYLPKPATADDVLTAFGLVESSTDESEIEETLSLARVEWEHIHRILAECEGNISETARRLGIHRRSLQRKLRKRAP